MSTSAYVFTLPSDSVLPVFIKNTFIDLEGPPCDLVPRTRARYKTLPSSLFSSPVPSAQASTADDDEENSLASSSVEASPRHMECPSELSVEDPQVAQSETSCCEYAAITAIAPCWYSAGSGETVKEWVDVDARPNAPSARWPASSSPSTALASPLQAVATQRSAHSAVQNDFNLQCATIVDAVSNAVVGSDKVVVGTQCFAELDSYTVIVRIRKERIRYKAAVLNKAQRALLQAADGTNGLYVIGSGSSPFQPVTYGFFADLGVVRDGIDTSRALAEQGWYQLGDECPADHFSHQVTIKVIVWKVD